MWLLIRLLNMSTMSERPAIDCSGGVGGRMNMSGQIMPSSRGKQNQSQEMSWEHHLYVSQEANLYGGKRPLLLLFPLPPSFVSCWNSSAFTFPWVNLGLIIMPLPVMRPVVKPTQVRHQMASCFAKHKCSKTANSVMFVMLYRVFGTFSMHENHLKHVLPWALHPEIPV